MPRPFSRSPRPKTDKKNIGRCHIIEILVSNLEAKTDADDFVVVDVLVEANDGGAVVIMSTLLPFAEML